MCGICGVISSDKAAAKERQVRAMCATMVTRGPDEEGVFADGQVALGIRRLKVIDLTSGRQPMTNEHGTVTVVLNGEIYNYRELRNDLVARGHVFTSQSDTETIVHGYEEWGAEVVERLNGMFAFAVYDARQRAVLLARDRFGEKPLYYAQVSGNVYFASTLKALMMNAAVPRRIDAAALDSYLDNLFVCHPRTIFKDVCALPPAHVMSVRSDGRGVTMRRYWCPPWHRDEQHATVTDDRAVFDDVVRSVRMRLVSDVPLGAFLSGGLDSSVIVAAMKASGVTPRTFSASFADVTFDESSYAADVAKHVGCDHQRCPITMDVAALVPQLIGCADAPFADSSMIPTYLISKAAREQVTVALSGDGGDELFGGYRRYSARDWERLYLLVPAIVSQGVQALARLFPEPSGYYGTSFIKKVKRFVEHAELIRRNAARSWMPCFGDAAKYALYEKEFAAAIAREGVFDPVGDAFRACPAHDPIERMMWVDQMVYLPGDILTKVDRMSMAVSLEVRAPFLDHQLAEMLARYPRAQKIRRDRTKLLLKRAFTGALPQRIINRDKHGFAVPLGQWINGELKNMIDAVLLDDAFYRRGFFSRAAVRQLLDDHRTRRRDNAERIWALYVLEMWMRQYVS